MKQTIHCNLFSCRYYEDEKCAAPELHIVGRTCREYEKSMEKFYEYMNDKDKNPDYPNYLDEELYSGILTR